MRPCHRQGLYKGDALSHSPSQAAGAGESQRAPLCGHGHLLPTGGLPARAVPQAGAVSDHPHLLAPPRPPHLVHLQHHLHELLLPRLCGARLLRQGTGPESGRGRGSRSALQLQGPVLQCPGHGGERGAAAAARRPGHHGRHPPLQARPGICWLLHLPVQWERR